MSLFTSEHRAFFEENGYALIPGVIPKENCDAVIDAIWEFGDMDRNNPEDWYRPPATLGGMIEMYHHQSMWDNRQNPCLYQVFADFWGTEKLWVNIDRVNMMLPSHSAHPEYEHKGSIHWDVSAADIENVAFGLQGVLYLSDTDETMGGFCCVPGFHKNLKEWIAEQPPDRHPSFPDLNRLPPDRKVTPIPGKTGDLVIWNSLLAHGNGHNVSDRLRFAQFIVMFPAREEDAADREARIVHWRNRTHSPNNPARPGETREVEQKDGKAAELTPLGRKLLGLDRW